ncbi:hypothetical protein DWB84_14715 [Saccharophagus sp. K07]|uniref:LpxL/LpxP family acyltransferase n=1 Tax=Saccharophagus sp. K07 TaxID=2283636 RepID=UPI001651C36D|nr:hypothetical protein [Saccharophagus sp. K07]MBC6906702.1 hypothetical protein [Saccharophagus sp. K07]
MEKKQRHWANLSESGSYWGLVFMLWLYRVFGRRLFNWILGPVAIYFFLVNGVARRASREFLNIHAERYPEYWKRPPNNWDVIRHIYSFGQAILDKLLAWSAPIELSCFAIQNKPALDAFLSRPTGKLIIGSHLGNLEFCRGFVQRYMEHTINILVYDQHAANFVKIMQKINPMSRINVYQVTQLDIPLILLFKTKLENGEWLFIAGDRIPVTGENSLLVDFFGKPAPFPIGPYVLGKTLQCEVSLMFSYRVGDKVNFELVPFADRVNLPRRDSEQLRHYVQTYANELERQAAKAPLQWFNFYPYWANRDERSADISTDSTS